MAAQIFEHEIAELQHCYGRFPSKGQERTLTTILDTWHPKLGDFQASNMALPDVHLLDVDWRVPDLLTIHESTPSETVDINFVLEGNVEGRFPGLDARFGLRSGTNNLKFTPTEKSSHYAARQHVNMFVISLNRSYFQDLIGSDNPWAEGIQRKMEKGDNFLASKEFLNTTPRMLSLVNAIRTMDATPLSRLMTQSMVIELVAHQIDQLINLREYRAVDDTLSAIDIEKLNLAKLYIDRHFLEDLTLTGLCREVMLNEFKLKKGFKSLFGMPVIQYVRQLRMELANTLLRDSALSVEEVAHKLGYRYPNHFTVAYKKHFGVVPSSHSYSFAKKVR